jgi:putative flippase GtrA
MKILIRQLRWFVAVGAAASATHWLTAVACIAWFKAPPFLGNFIGWSVAVVVSFSGHYFLTFRHQTKSMRHAIRRFLILSAGGFAVNQFAFINLLATTGIPYYWLLAFILVAIAALTFVVSRYWAFRHSP